MKRLLQTAPIIVSLLLVAGATLKAQNTLAVSPVTTFLPAAVPGGPAVSQSIVVTSSPAGAISYTTAFSNAPWLTITPSTGTTPATVFVTGNPAGLAAGVYSAVVTISSPAASSVTALVVLTVNNITLLNSSPANIVFNYVPGSPLPAPQTLTISSGGGAPPAFNVIANNAPWLLVGPSANSITLAISPGGLTPGQPYVGSVQVTPVNGGSPLFIPVVLYYQGVPQITASPASLNFNYQIGGTNNIVQKSVTVAPAGSNFTATATVAAGTTQWLSVNPTTGTGSLTATVQPAGLPAGTYQGSISITQAGANTVTVPVSLNVNTQTLLDLSTNSLTYAFQSGGANPPDQIVTPTSTTPGVFYTVAASSQGNWLSVNVTNNITPTPVTVSVSPGGLPAGAYTGTLSFNAVGAANNPQTVTVTLNVTNNPALTPNPASLVFNYQTGQAIPGSQSVAVTSNGPGLSFTVAGNGQANGINWLLTGAPTASTTPASFTVGVNPVGLTPNVYNGTIQLTSPGAPQVNMPVTLNVSNVALLNLPSSLSFTSVVASQPGQTGPSQNVTVTSTGEAVTYSVTASTSTPPASNWLVVGATSGPASNVIPSSFIVAANPSGLQAGVYKGSLLVHAANGTPDVTIPVTYTVTSGNLAVAPATLSFTQTAGGPAPAAQAINVSSSGVPLVFSALTSVSTPVNWLTVTPGSGTTPGAVTVSVNSGTLQAGTYTGTVTITSTAAGNSPQTVTVNLTVGPAQNLSVAPVSMSFTSQTGSAAPPAQAISVTASNGNLPFTVTTNTTSGGQGWLTATPTSGTAGQTAVNVNVSVNPAAINPPNAGTYTGTVVITGQGASNGPQTVNISYVLTAIPTPVPARVQNAGSAAIGPVAPGEIISIFGTNLGPTVPVTTTVSSTGFFATTLSDTQVLFDNIPAAMWFTSAVQINAIVPYEIAGRASTVMQVLYKGAPSATINLQVAAAAPGIFTSQNGQAAVVNQDGNVNGPSSPAPKNTSILIYATGEGATNPAGVTGKVIPADPTQLKRPVAPVSVTIGGQPAELQYAGSAPGYVSGALQVNVLIPVTAPSGSAVPVVLTVGNISSQGQATIAIQ